MDNGIEVCIGIIGRGGVGKSSIVRRIINGAFSEQYDPPIDDEFFRICILNEAVITTKIHKFVYQEFPYLMDRWIRECHSFALIYSVLDKSTLEDILEFHKQIQLVFDVEDYPKILIGNKSDLTMKRVVKTKEGKELAKKINCKFIETSAKTNENINQLFYESSLLAFEELKKKENENQKNQNKKKKGKCLLIIGLFGNGGVGKTAITRRFIRNIFIEDYEPNIEEAYRKIVDLNYEKILINIFDTVGSEEYYIIDWRFQVIRIVFVYIYSITDRNNYPKILIGNKSDLFTKREVKTKEGKELAKKLNCKFIETSAKTGENFNQLFYESSLLGIEELKNNQNQNQNENQKNQNKKKKGKCLLIIGLFGKQGVGKSTITIRFITNHFIEEYDPTIEEEYKKEIELNDKKIMLNILDTATAEEFYSVYVRWARYSQVVVYVYSISDRDSFKRMKKIQKMIQKIKKNHPKILIGNKSDLTMKRAISIEEGKELANKLNCKFIETSAKTGENIQQLFYESALLGIEELENPNQNENENKKGKCSLM
ncbi:ras-like protein [Anaeramoeba ignava]|uniref:Ras-like protein n=1 Tax=Anaeramoeba ignava TaxID=1746090 RepID=A0A9Q0R7D8_ANAIG|nr:ras-like protein [Anaeramoeba ignava]